MAYSTISIGNLNVGKVCAGISEVDKIYLGNELIYYSGGNPFLTFSSSSAFTLRTYNQTPTWDGTLYYSTNRTAWSVWDGTTITAVAKSGKYYIYLRGSGNTVITGNSNNHFVFSGNNISCSGNIECLLDWETVIHNSHPTMAAYCYYRLFRNCSALISAPELPAVTLSNYCYSYMFWNCTSLTASPSLSATTLTEDCYSYMFQDCTSLRILPLLPAITLPTRCYRSMFSGCTAISIYAYAQAGGNKYRVPTSGTGTIAGASAIDGMFEDINSSSPISGSSFNINTTYYVAYEPV